MGKKIICLDYDKNIMANCHYEIYQDGQLSAQGQTHSNGEAFLDQGVSFEEKMVIRFWPSERSKETAYETNSFVWEEDAEAKWLRAPKEYIIPLRQTENTANEPANYMQKWHEVVEGDTLESLSRQYGTTMDAFNLKNNLSGAQLEIGYRLYLPIDATRPTDKV